MKRIKKVIYLSADEIDELVQERETVAESLPEGVERQSVLKEVSQLRMYADAKRWIDSPGLKPDK